MNQRPVQLPPLNIQLLLIEDDPIFRAGMRVVCESDPGLEIGAEVETGIEALEVLSDWKALASQAAANNDLADPPTRVIILDLASSLLLLQPLQLEQLLDQIPLSEPDNLLFCYWLTTQYPEFPVLIFTALQDQELLNRWQQMGVAGYCPKGVSSETLRAAIYRVARGESDWQFAAKLTDSPAMASTATRTSSQKLSLLDRFRHNLGQSGLRQIDRVIATLNQELRDPETLDRNNISQVLNELILRGQRRELLTARWLVSQLLPTTERLNALSPSNTPETISTDIEAAERVEPSGALALTGETALETSSFSTNDLKSALLDATVAKLRSGLTNQTGIPLEIDILRINQRQGLIYIVLRQFEHYLDEMRFSQVQLDHISEKSQVMLQDIWAASVTDFYGKYSTVERNNRSIEIVPVLLRDEPLVYQEILGRIPLVPELLAHLLFQDPLMIDNLSCGVGSPEAMQRSEALLQNLVIHVANAVVQPLLNSFADVEAIKHKFYDRRLLSTREIEKFRNNLSWYYRVDRFFREPQAIFESCYHLVVLGNQGIQAKTIYAPRNLELVQLSGIPLAVTLALEARDAVAPRVRSALSLLGSGIVYVLTQVIGRGIGLVGRGIVQGIGSSLQDNPIRAKKDSSRQ
ncbi:MAG: DUF3685 domain-containing protein [Microcoleaceae cyanobacterium]